MSRMRFVADYTYRHAKQRAVGEVWSSAAFMWVGRKGRHTKGSVLLTLSLFQSGLRSMEYVCTCLQQFQAFLFALAQSTICPRIVGR